MDDKQQPNKAVLRKRVHPFRRVLLCVCTLPLTAWAAMAIYYSNLPGEFLRAAVSAMFVIVAVGIPFFPLSVGRAIAFYSIGFGAVLVWWWLIPASNHRAWKQDVAELSYAEIDGDEITIHNIRNFDYHSEDTYTPEYYDKTFSLSNLQTADLYIVFWGPTLIAHTMMSFGFGDEGYVCISIETRKEEDESYSAIKGFFKQYELIYIVADERDVVRLRTNFRHQDVYLYRLKADPVLVREVFLDYFKQINQLADEPQWYNALTQNCTTTIRGHTAPYAHGKMSWKLLANGYLDTLLYDRKVIDTSLPFGQMKMLSYINEKAMKAGDTENFSIQIREGLPNPKR